MVIFQGWWILVDLKNGEFLKMVSFQEWCVFKNDDFMRWAFKKEVFQEWWIFESGELSRNSVSRMTKFLNKIKRFLSFQVKKFLWWMSKKVVIKIKSL